MTRIALAGAILLAAALPLWGQDPPKQELDKLKVENAAKATRIQDLQKQLDFANTQRVKTEGDANVLVRQLEVQLGQIQDLAAKVEDYRGQLAKALNQKKLSEQEAEHLKKSLAQLEEKHVELARERAPAAEKLDKVVPSRRLDGVVTAVANEIGLVVLSVGKDDGVREGDEFTVTRAGGEVTKVVIDRVDRKWSAGKVVQKKLDPRVGDDASKRVSAPESPETIQGIRKELDEVRRQVRELSDRVLPAWKEHGLALEEASEDLRAHLAIARGLLVRGIREGSPAEKAGLKPLDVVVDLTEPQFLDAIAKGQTIRVVRQGRARTLGER